MTQPSQYAINFAGPFLGLNTVTAPHMLAPGFATVAQNVLITRGGGVRPRDPWRMYWQETLLGLSSVCVGMLHLDVARLAGSTDDGDRMRVLSKMYDGKLLQTSAFAGPAQHVDLTGPGVRSNYQPTWVLANRRLYVIDGSARMIQYDGDTVRTIGIEVPTMAGVSEWQDPPQAQVEFKRREGGAGPDAGTYAYTATFYDSVYGIESNAKVGLETPMTVVLDGSNRVAVKIHPFLWAGLAQRGIDRVRIYRRHRADVDGTELGLPFRLIAEIYGWPPGAESFDWDNEVPDDEVTLSDVVTGPFAPTRNGIPPAARIAVWYKNRMWYADPDDGTRLWYSEHAFPEHVGSTSFIPIGGDPDDIITGMVEMAGQIIILKKDSIWVLSGDLETYNNARVALGHQPGVDFAESFPEVYKTKSKTGCHNTQGGNGAIVCGHPPLLFYSNANGLYRFDGVDDRLVSDLIMDEWKAVVGSLDHSISYAVDLANEVLYVCPTAPVTSNPFPQRFLCYHWGVNRGDGVGVWTTVTNIGDPIPQPGSDFLERLGIACIATCLGTPSTQGTPNHETVGDVSPFLVAGLYFYTPPSPITPPTFYSVISYASTQVDERQPTPEWLWRTGDLMLAGGKKAHLYYLEYRHERAKSEVGGGPTVKVRYAIDDRDLELLSPSENGLDTKGVFLRRHHMGRTGRSLALEFSRGSVTDWEAWNGLTGFALDVELAEQR
jgi:hypothetical protein